MKLTVTQVGPVTLSGVLASRSIIVSIPSTSLSVPIVLQTGLTSLQTPGAGMLSWPAGAQVANGTYDISVSWPWQSGVVTSITAKAGSGSFTMALHGGASGAAIAGLSAVTVNGATPVTTNAGANTISAGQRLYLVISGATGSPTDASVQVNYTHSQV